MSLGLAAQPMLLETRHSHSQESWSPRLEWSRHPFALVIEIEPVTSPGPCNTVHFSPDGREGFNVFLHGLFASDFVDRVADVPTSAVVRRARDGAIHGIISQGSEDFSGVSQQKPALPAGEDGGHHLRRNHGRTHTLLQPRDAHLATSVDLALLPLSGHCAPRKRRGKL